MSVQMLRVFSIGRVLGIRLDVHTSWFIVYAFVAWTLANDAPIAAFGRPAALAVGGIAALLLFASVVVHEFAHALVARAFGVPTRSIALFLFGGVATLESEAPHPLADALVALAGPAISFVAAALAYGALFLTDRVVPPGASDAVAAIAAYLIYVNLMLGAFNLIPAYPMDGGRVLRALLWNVRGDRDGATVSAAIVGLGFAALFAAGGVVAAIATRTWQFGWFVVLSTFLFRQCWTQYEALRIRRPAGATAPNGWRLRLRRKPLEA